MSIVKSQTIAKSQSAADSQSPGRLPHDQVPLMIGVRVAAAGVGMVLALAGGVLAANVPSIGAASITHATQAPST